MLAHIVPCSQLLHDHVAPYADGDDNTLQSVASTCLLLIFALLVALQTGGVGSLMVSVVCVTALLGLLATAFFFQSRWIARRRKLVRGLTKGGEANHFDKAAFRMM